MGEDVKKIGRYEILDKLGQGAMGIVYKAMDPNIGRIVALKTISQSATLPEAQKKEYAARFFREAKAAGSLQHPNIVTIYDMDEDQGIPYIAMEYVEGKSLSKMIEEQGRIPWNDAVAIIKATAEGLMYAHEKGIVHRDIKPDNILIDRNGRPVVTDFGIAHLQESSLTRTGEVLGTPFFMSPEQILEGKLDARSDLFSLGVVFYLMLTGHRPFRGETISSICYHIVHTPPEQLPTDDSIPSHLMPILNKMLEKDPDRRYAGEKPLIADLEKALGGHTVMQAEVETINRPVQPETPRPQPEKQAAQPPAAPKAKPASKTPAPPPAPSVPAAPKKKSSAMPLVIIGGIAFVVFLAAVLGGGYYMYSKGFFGGKGGENIEEPPAVSEPDTGGDLPETPQVEQRIPPDDYQEPKQDTPRSGTQPSGETTQPPPVKRPVKQQEERPAVQPKEPDTPPPPTAEETKPVQTKPAKIGLVFETRISEISLTFYLDGEEKLREVYTAESGTRFTQEFRVPPGQHSIRVVVQATKFPPFIREGSFNIDLSEGGHQVIKIEPSRKPAPRLTIKKIDVITGASTTIMEK
ncbi:MAG TPA: serine/threonine-protein kinase [Acidobacteriota bacterium]|nr:serine/threonine-protein kinase [Acidobacteriota bacterium]HNT18011.1 serine/threonine-protein kinase [Acidobacteriota bacterium]HPA26634.1 serine/threonine-protein kinase [Acidobacteriota bacterium]HQO19484.1 serine/threonine-protein kinase [Acidobacteriota bacterium]HQQ45984.1 serine/threonine-protein kinase [Acidobacteriota bacterium]